MSGKRIENRTAGNRDKKNTNKEQEMRQWASWWGQKPQLRGRGYLQKDTEGVAEWKGSAEMQKDRW